MGLKIKVVVECNGKTAPYYDIEPCPDKSSVEVMAEYGGRGISPELPEGWVSHRALRSIYNPDGRLNTEYSCPGCEERSRKEDGRG